MSGWNGGEEEEEGDSEIYEIVEVCSFVRALLVFPPEESSTTESGGTEAEVDEGLTKVPCNPCMVPGLC